MKKCKYYRYNNLIINPLTSPGAGAPALNYRYVNTVTPSPGEVNGLINDKINLFVLNILERGK